MEQQKIVVFCDDNPATCHAFALWMKRRSDVRVTCLRTGYELLYFLEDQKLPPDLVIVDLVLPDIDGDDIVAQLKKKGYTAPILLISGWIVNLDERARAIGATDYMLKPFTPQELEAKIDALILT